MTTTPHTPISPTPTPKGPTPKGPTLATVMKHEWLRLRLTLIVHWAIAAAVVAGAAALLATGWPLISTLGQPVGIAAIASLLVGGLVWLAIDLWRSSFGRHGYLTQALPLKGSTIFAGKLISGLLAYLATTVVAAGLGLVLSVSPPGSRHAVRSIWQQLVAIMPTWGWVLFPLAIMASVVLYLTQAYCAVSLGALARFRTLGTGAPVLMWVLLYFVSQAVSLLAMVAIPVVLGVGPTGQLELRTANVAALLAQGNDNQLVPVGFGVGMVILIIGYIASSLIVWKRRVSLA